MLRLMVLLLCVFAAQAYADYYDTDLTREQAQVRRIEDQQRDEGRTSHTDDLEREKEKIFKQLEIIDGDEETKYIIVPGDTLSIIYLDRGTKSGALYKVTAEGEVHMPLINSVRVGGLNRQKARELITAKLQEYIRNPQVELTVNAAGRVMVLGEVNLPGLYAMQPNLTVMEAIMKAGSYEKDNARLRSVVLVRGTKGAEEVKKLNLHKLITKGDRSDDLLVKPGDLIYVPKTIIADLTKFKDEVYRWVSLYYSYGRLPAPPAVEANQPILYDR